MEKNVCNNKKVWYILNCLFVTCSHEPAAGNTSPGSEHITTKRPDRAANSSHPWQCGAGCDWAADQQPGANSAGMVPSTPPGNLLIP